VRPLQKSALAVVSFALIGGLIAGDPTTGPFEEMAKPDFSPNLGICIGIGIVYYIAMSEVLRRLFAVGSDANPAILGVLSVLAANEIWNVLLFRLGRADLAFWSLWPFLGLVILTAELTRHHDRLAAMIILAYALWLGFDIYWAHSLAGLNPAG
jgi:tryptophan-rich sensory protein